MKSTKAAFILSLVLTSISASVQAIELVKVEQISKTEFHNQLHIDLANSVKSMQLNAINVKVSTDTLLIAYSKKTDAKQDNSKSKESLLSE